MLSLSGPSMPFDRRVTAVRGDLADIALATVHLVPHYAVPEYCMASIPHAPILGTGSADAMAVSELIFGESFAVLDRAGGYAWGYSTSDLYVGYVAEEALTAAETPKGTRLAVTARSALLFVEPDLKSAISLRLPMGARLVAMGESDDGNYWQTQAGWVSKRHCEAEGQIVADAVALARRLTGAPYVWGGRSGDGLDCSGLIQMVLGLLGIAVQRDTDQQAATLGQELALDAPKQAGDCVYMPGHVVMMTDDTHAIHANAHWMQVREEPLADIVARLDAEHGITALRRPRP